MSVAAVDSEVGLSERFWIKFRRESVLALYTPFVLCLASGNLRIETFRHYIAQDVHFLRAFAQAWVYFLFFYLLFRLFDLFGALLVFFFFVWVCLVDGKMWEWNWVYWVLKLCVLAAKKVW
jgi:hypothetical protein